MLNNKTLKYLKDYHQPNFLAKTIALTFEVLDSEQKVLVKSVTNYSLNPSSTINTLELDGDSELSAIYINDRLLSDNEYLLLNNKLIIENLPSEFALTVHTIVFPWQNKSYMGLYESRGNLLTQCEAEGFRHITYYQDRPDVMATYTVTIIANKDKFNSMLSNGNLIKEHTEGNIRTVTWHDPFKKPSYLFAVVIANLKYISDNYITKSGRNVLLEVYAEPKYLHNLQHAMDSVKRAMRWDEDRFNLEYDLDRYMIVASSDFNMGAMENKGLNIFNTKYVLADKKTSTDNDYILIEAVVGHEYFHNWTGNRVTCKNWFQLSLKEGLTVFRDQEFTADLHGRSVKRIQDVATLRRRQFPEDSGALAHPVRPESYLEMNNFYTMTVYEKGAEIVRMYQTILGKDGFNKGMELYFERHDGYAVSCEDFCNAMADANHFDLSQFMLWYLQAGTPYVTVKDTYKPDTQEYMLEFTQKIPDTPGQTNKKPQLIPIKFGLLDGSGYDLLNFEVIYGLYIKHSDGIVLLLDDYQNKFVFKNVVTRPTPSLLREFSAPIKLEYNYTESQRMLIINHDSDEFSRYEHLQQIIIKQIKSVYSSLILNDSPIIDSNFKRALNSLLKNPNLDPNFIALAFTLPSFAEMQTIIKDINPNLLSKAITFVEQEIGEQLFDSLMEVYNLNLTMHYSFADHGKRALKNIALFYLIRALNRKLNNEHSLQLVETLTLGQLHNADNMTDELAVLVAINNTNNGIRNTIFDEYYQKWQDNELVMDKWFALQASSNLITVEQLNKLLVDKAFISTNPNKIYSLLNTFTTNGEKFNTDSGYSFIADQVIAIDKFNPQVASRLVTGFNQASNMQNSYKVMAKTSLQRILKQDNLSNNVLELGSKIMDELVNSQ
ncbi:MAG: aminopeptidase N [Neisseriaceae bacterium]